MKSLLPFLFLLLAISSFADDRITLRETISNSPFHNLAQSGDFTISGHTTTGISTLHLRVTDIDGTSTTATATVANQHFTAQYPADFPKAPALQPGFYFIDASESKFPAQNPPDAEALKIVYTNTGPQRLPDFPSAFTTDLRGIGGSTDKSSPEYPRTRALAALYHQSRAAKLANIYNPNFDLNNPRHLDLFKNSRSLYDYENRDRDWSTPLNRRPARGFWKAVYTSWFNAGNSTPRPGDPRRDNPDTFTNDLSDILVLNLRRLRQNAATARFNEDNLHELCADILKNLCALQRRPADTLAPPGVQKPGAFYYGLFIDGTLMLPGTGWFLNENHSDHRNGGVFAGRAIWALGEALSAPPATSDTTEILATLTAALRWTLGEAANYSDKPSAQKYLRQVKGNDGKQHLLWRSTGEHAYLALGLIAASNNPATRNTPVFAAGEYTYKTPQTIGTLTISALDTLAQTLSTDTHQWTHFADIDGTSTAALARAAQLFRHQPELTKPWLAAARQAADAWIAAKPDPKKYQGKINLLCGRRYPDDPKLLRYDDNNETILLPYFHTGLWLQALAELYAATNDPKYLNKFNEQLGYFCGDNPFHVRLLTELGGIYNFTTAKNNSRIENRLTFDLYPESTAFIQIALIRHLQTLATQK